MSLYFAQGYFSSLKKVLFLQCNIGYVLVSHFKILFHWDIFKHVLNNLVEINEA